MFIAGEPSGGHLYNNQEVQASQVSFTGWVGKQNVL